MPITTLVTRRRCLESLGGLLVIAVAAAPGSGCLSDVCADLEYKTASFTSLQEIEARRVETLAEGLARSGIQLGADQRLRLQATGQLFGLVKLERPVKHPNGALEIPAGWMPPLATPDHPWRRKLTPADDAFYSYFEDRIVRARLYDPTDPQHRDWARAYLAKARSSSPRFTAWTHLGDRTECAKKKYDGPLTIPAPDADDDAAQLPKCDALYLEDPLTWMNPTGVCGSTGR